MNPGRVVSIDEVEYEIIEFKNIKSAYRRYASNSWQIIETEMLEPQFDCSELEEAYQQWLQEEKGKEKAMNKEREGKMSVPPEKMRRPKHFAIMDTLASLQRMVSNLEDLRREVERGERSKGPTEIIERNPGDEKVAVILENPDLLPLSQFLIEAPNRIELMAESIAKSVEGLREMLF